jgi:murein DD-endopeptidase MepM/ murein hydrolase activator NlpD
MRMHKLLQKFIALTCATLLTVALISPHIASAAPIAPSLSVIVNPRTLRPGQAGYVFVGGAYPLEVTVALDDISLDVFWSGDGYIALFAFGFDAPAQDHVLSVQVYNPLSGETLEKVDTITVTAYQYPHEDVALPSRLIPLLDPTLNQNELDELSSIYARRSYPGRWDWPYGLPVTGGMVTSRFGGDRSYNGGILRAHHAGTDFRRAEGEPIVATADGKIAVARLFDIRGNVVIIDHGYGVFSEYAHLSAFYVQPGDFVERGQLIGAAGVTGRVNGPHLHFEIIVNGIPIDPIAWMALTPNFVPPQEVTSDHTGG